MGGGGVVYSGVTPGYAALNQAVLSKVSHSNKPQDCTVYERLVFDHESRSLKQSLEIAANTQAGCDMFSRVLE